MVLTKDWKIHLKRESLIKRFDFIFLELTGECPKVFEGFGVEKGSKSGKIRANLVKFRVEKVLFCL